MTEIRAVIFDMDGVLVDTEPLWRKVMIEGFLEAGIDFTDEDCKLTTGMRFDKVVEHWSRIRPFRGKTPQQLHDDVIDNLCNLILNSNVEMKGVEIAFEACERHNLLTGLATSSNSRIVKTVLKKIERETYFKSVESAEHLDFGKPHPQVFLNCANSLQINPENCIVIEDSVNGIIAAKAAHMKAIAVPDPLHTTDPRFSIADYKIGDLEQFPELLKKLKGGFHTSA